MSKLKEMAAKSSINNMLKGGHFSVSTIDRVAEMFGQRAGGEAYSILKAIHCVDFEDMDEELRSEIPALIASALQFEAIPSSIRSSSNVIEMKKLM